MPTLQKTLTIASVVSASRDSFKVRLQDFTTHYNAYSHSKKLLMKLELYPDVSHDLIMSKLFNVRCGSSYRGFLFSAKSTIVTFWICSK